MGTAAPISTHVGREGRAAPTAGAKASGPDGVGALGRGAGRYMHTCIVWVGRHGPSEQVTTDGYRSSQVSNTATILIFRILGMTNLSEVRWQPSFYFLGCRCVHTWLTLVFAQPPRPQPLPIAMLPTWQAQGWPISLREPASKGWPHMQRGRRPQLTSATGCLNAAAASYSHCSHLGPCALQRMRLRHFCWGEEGRCG